MQVGSLICILQRLVFYAWAIPGALLYVMRKTDAGGPEDGDELLGTTSTS